MKAEKYNASLIKGVQGYSYVGCKTVPHVNAKLLLWGLNPESDVRRMYEKFMKLKQDQFKLESTGLFVSEAHPFVRVSPDGLASCSCHSKKWIIEIKCPYSIESLDATIAAKQRMLKYLTKVDGQFIMVPGEVRVS